MIKEYLKKRRQFEAAKLPAQTLLELYSKWGNGGTADEMIVDLKRSRKNTMVK